MIDKILRSRAVVPSLLGVLLFTACSPQSDQPEVSTPPALMSTAEAAAPEPSLGINPRGKTELEIDMSRIHNPDLVSVFDHIDANIDEHVQNLQRWIQQPSVSNTGEGIQESAYMVEGFFDQFGCQETEVVDPGLTELSLMKCPIHHIGF